MSNQEDKKDNGKLPLTQVPSEIIYNIAAVRQFGMKKYSKEPTWKNVEVERYRDAMYRHWLAYIEDPYGVDEESGLPHLYHVAWNCATLCDLEKDKFKPKKEGVDLSEIKCLKLPDTKDIGVSVEDLQKEIEKSEMVGKVIRNCTDADGVIVTPDNVPKGTVDADGFDWKKGDYVKPKDTDYELNIGGITVK